MGAPKLIKVVIVAGAVVLSGCATAPETTRTTKVGLETQASIRGTGRMLSALSAEFRREVPHVINFDFDSSLLDAEARQRLDAQAAWIGDNPGVRFAVTGHTDRVGNVAYNEALGLARAQAAVDYMVARGVSETQLVAMISEGETDPVIKTENRERANRRVETDVLELIREEDPVRLAGLDDATGSISSNGGGTPDDGNGGGTPDGNGGGTPDGNGGGTPDGNGGGTPDGNGGGSPDGNGGGADDNGGRDKPGKGSQANSGRGNGDEDRDPGKSGGKNQGGDEL